MDHSNYTIFEILKYKIEFLECLEYSLLTYKIDEEDIKKRLFFLKNDFKDGMYQEIVSTLFTSFNKLNSPIIYFLKHYPLKKITNMTSNKNAKSYLNYNERLIDAYETFNYIINMFLEEEQIKNKLDKKVLELININNNHFNNFLFFNIFTLYVEIISNKETEIKYTEKDIIRLIRIMNYCNKNNDFNSSIEILKEEDNEAMYKEIENLSNKCVKFEKEQYMSLKELINIINTETNK